MMSDKSDVPILNHNPGVMIGKDEMAKYIEFERAVSKSAEVPRINQNKMNSYL